LVCSCDVKLWIVARVNSVRYDAVDKTLFIDSRVGDFTSFISTATGFGTVGLKAGNPFVKLSYGNIEVNRTVVCGKELKG